MRRSVSPEQQRARIVARAIKGVKGEQWRALPAEERREAIHAARRVIRVLSRPNLGEEKAREAGDE